MGHMSNTIAQKIPRAGSSSWVLIKTGVTHTCQLSCTAGTGDDSTSSSPVISPLAEVVFYAFAGQGTASQAPWNVLTISDLEQRSAGDMVLQPAHTLLWGKP